MTRFRPLALAAFLAVGALPFLAAPPSSKASLPAPPSAKMPPKPETVSKLTAPNVAGLPGEKKVISAVLSVKSFPSLPLAGKMIKFRISGKNPVPPGGISVGQASTDASGRAALLFPLPELPQGNYQIHAAWNGDADTPSASGEANLLMVKGITKVEFMELWQAPPRARFRLMRTLEPKLLFKPMKVTVNGTVKTVEPESFEYGGYSVKLPLHQDVVIVHAQFEGDGIYAASAAEKLYIKP